MLQSRDDCCKAVMIVAKLEYVPLIMYIIENNPCCSPRS